MKLSSVMPAELCKYDLDVSQERADVVKFAYEHMDLPYVDPWIVQGLWETGLDALRIYHNVGIDFSHKAHPADDILILRLESEDPGIENLEEVVEGLRAEFRVTINGDNVEEYVRFGKGEWKRTIGLMKDAGIEIVDAQQTFGSINPELVERYIEHIPTLAHYGLRPKRTSTLETFAQLDNDDLVFLAGEGKEMHASLSGYRPHIVVADDLTTLVSLAFEEKYVSQLPGFVSLFDYAHEHLGLEGVRYTNLLSVGQLHLNGGVEALTFFKEKLGMTEVSDEWFEPLIKLLRLTGMDIPNKLLEEGLVALPTYEMEALLGLNTRNMEYDLGAAQFKEHLRKLEGIGRLYREHGIAHVTRYSDELLANITPAGNVLLLYGKHDHNKALIKKVSGADVLLEGNDTSLYEVGEADDFFERITRSKWDLIYISLHGNYDVGRIGEKSKITLDDEGRFAAVSEHVNNGCLVVLDSCRMGYGREGRNNMANMVKRAWPQSRVRAATRNNSGFEFLNGDAQSVHGPLLTYSV